MKKLLAVAALAFLGLSGAVLSQTIAVPQVQAIHPTDLIQIIPYGQPSAQSQYASQPQVVHQTGYYKSAPGTGFSYQFGANVTQAAFKPSGTLAVGYVALESNPSDGARNCVFSTQQVTALYICAATTGPSSSNCSTTNVNSPIAGTLSANTGACYLYSLSNQTWDRSN